MPIRRVSILHDRVQMFPGYYVGRKPSNWVTGKVVTAMEWIPPPGRRNEEPMADGFDRHASPGRHTHRAATQSRPAPYEPAPGRGRPGLRRVSAAALVMLVLQYG